MMRTFWIWCLRLFGLLILGVAGIFSLMGHSLFTRGGGLLLNIFVLFVLSFCPAVVSLYMLGRANALSDQTGVWSFGASLGDRLIAVIGTLIIGGWAYAIFMALGFTARFVVIVAVVWTLAGYYYFRVLDGWSSIAPRTRARIRDV